MLFMAGRGDAYEKYLETLEHWRGQGWQVVAADWRGQGGSGRLGRDETTGHQDDYAGWVQDLAAIWQDFAGAQDGPLVLAGHSMGGHLVLRACMDGALTPHPDALVLSAPMLDVVPETMPLPIRHALAALMARVGDARRPAWRGGESPLAGPDLRQRLLTHDNARYGDELFWREQRPELAMGPGSWGWVRASLASIRHIFGAGRAEAMTVPTTIVATSADRLVGPAAIRRMADRLPDVELTEFGKEARHEILREEDAVRDRALAAIDAFLDRRLPRS